MYNVTRKGYSIRDIPRDETSISSGIDLVFVNYHEIYQANNLVHQRRKDSLVHTIKLIKKRMYNTRLKIDNFIPQIRPKKIEIHSSGSRFKSENRKF